jgi:hypothetical protein
MASAINSKDFAGGTRSFSPLLTSGFPGSTGSFDVAMPPK